MKIGLLSIFSLVICRNFWRGGQSTESLIKISYVTLGTQPGNCQSGNDGDTCDCRGKADGGLLSGDLTLLLLKVSSLTVTEASKTHDEPDGNNNRSPTSLSGRKSRTRSRKRRCRCHPYEKQSKSGYEADNEDN
ncbi:hypothetical protein HWI79_2047 [Cryptosporidium felis]|nr:hypothetical protein HWI79_2047 [Cryptosporidium felis]